MSGKWKTDLQFLGGAVLFQAEAMQLARGRAWSPPALHEEL